MRTWKYLLLAVLVNVVFALALGLLFWANGALALPLGRPSGPVAPESSLGAVPREMNYQGLLLDDQGNPVEGTHDLLFTIYQHRLYPIPGDWIAVYSETHAVDLDRGLFNVALGSQTPLDPGIFDGIVFWGGDLVVGVAVDGGAEMSPRAPLLTSPYAFRSEYTNNMPWEEFNGYEEISTRPDPIAVTFDHNLGGDPGDYIVDLVCEDDSLGTFDCGRASGTYAYWYNLTDTQITVWVEGGSLPDAIRVRIWLTK